jgi:serine protease Do
MRKLKFTILVLSTAVLGSGCFLLDNASSEPKTVTPPATKPTEQAIKDLKTEVPLDLSKLSPPLPANLWVELSKLLNPTVVSITTSANIRSQARFRDPLQEFMEEFYGGRGFQPMPQQQQVQALGTGFIIREDGLIITNNHVVEQADVIKVQLDNNDTKLYEAEVVGRDSRTDIALIKIDAKKKLPFAKFGSSKDVQVGEYVAAFGNPYGHAHTMTTGIVSAIGREIAELNRFPFIQTDASINPGNSGGPLVNTSGLVIGVNTAIDARAQGIGFAIPIDNVKQIVDQLEKEGRIRRGYIGVGVNAVTAEAAAQLGMDEPRGVLVGQVEMGQPADRAGIKPYDIIIEFGGKKTDSLTDLQDAVGEMKIGSSAKAKIWRYNDQLKKKELTLDVKIGENPADLKTTAKATKKYFGQKAPFDMGFKVADWNDKTADDLGAMPGGVQGPIITEVEPNSTAARVGLQPGDVIVDVNRQMTRRATDVLKLLRRERNFVRIARGNMILIVTM